MRRERRPWSLVRRLTGGVVLVALLSFAAQAFVLNLWLRPVMQEVVASAAEQARQLRAALQAVEPAQRPALAQRLSSPQALLSQETPRLLEGPPAPVAPEVQETAQDLQAEGVELRLVPDGDATAVLLFRLPVDGDEWWLARTVMRPGAAVSGTLLIWLALLALATLSALWVSVRLIARPLARLTAQISAQQGTLKPLPERSDASTEMRALVQAFNELAHQAGSVAQARQQLLAGVSHDLRTPLARLRLRVETQCEEPVAEALTADLLSLERIVNQFLAYVQGDAGAMPGPEAPLHDSVRAFVQRCQAAGQALEMQVEPVKQRLPELAVQRLLGNLVDNAQAYGKAPVRVELRALPDGGAELRVSDAGPGMNPEDFKRAQQPFVRLTEARSELGHCGLGLAIVAQMARQLGGRLRAGHEGGRWGIVLALPA